MNSEKEKTTAPGSLVGASEGQSNDLTSNNSIPDCIKEINEEDEISVEEMEKLYREALRKNDPAYLHTVSLGELYETVYHSRPPVIDGLLCAGAYILAGAPKIGKSFLVAQIAYHVSTGQKLWEYDVRQGTVLYLALEDDYQRLQECMFGDLRIPDVRRVGGGYTLLRHQCETAREWTG